MASTHSSPSAKSITKVTSTNRSLVVSTDPWRKGTTSASLWKMGCACHPPVDGVSVPTHQAPWLRALPVDDCSLAHAPDELRSKHH